MDHLRDELRPLSLVYSHKFVARVEGEQFGVWNFPAHGVEDSVSETFAFETSTSHSHLFAVHRLFFEDFEVDGAGKSGDNSWIVEEMCILSAEVMYLRLTSICIN